MAEYISREETVKKIEEKLKVDDLMSLAEEVWTDNCLKIVLKAIMAVETANVQPVKRGRWETWGYVFHGIEWKRCSVCGKTADVSYIALLEGRIEPVTLSLCGCCGARMDGEQNDD